MKVRVFVPSIENASPEQAFHGADYTFPAIPAVGQTLRFTDERAADFTVASIGYVQDADAFIPAVWLSPDVGQSGYSDQTAAANGAEYLDLNHDVPPESMTSY